MKNKTIVGGMITGVMLTILALLSSVIGGALVNIAGGDGFVRAVCCWLTGVAGACFCLKRGRKIQGRKGTLVYCLVLSVTFFAGAEVLYHLPHSLIELLPFLKTATEPLPRFRLPIIGIEGTAIRQCIVAFLPVFLIGGAYEAGRKAAVHEDGMAREHQGTIRFPIAVALAAASGIMMAVCHHIVFIIIPMIPIDNITIGMKFLIDAILTVCAVAIASMVYWRLSQKASDGGRLLPYALLSLLGFALGMGLMLVLDVVIPDVMFLLPLFPSRRELGYGDGIEIMLFCAFFSVLTISVNTMRTAYVLGKERGRAV
jgi:hypothetical protein